MEENTGERGAGGKNHVLVLPGEFLGTSEEYFPGEGVYEEGGEIFSSVVGYLEKDEEERVLSVVPANPPVVLRRGDHVLGVVSGLYESMVLVDILMVDGNPRPVAGTPTGAIHISKMDRGYVSDVKKLFRLGDIVRAEVVQTNMSVQLVTHYPHLGVVFARCTRCRTPMVKERGRLRCPNCDNVETRKMADDYGNVRFEKSVFNERHRERRKERRDRGIGPKRGSKNRRDRRWTKKRS